MTTTRLADLTKEFALALRPPARTARGRARPWPGRLALIRARTRLVVAHTAVTVARTRVQQAQAAVARRGHVCWRLIGGSGRVGRRHLDNEGYGCGYYGAASAAPRNAPPTKAGPK
jgi:hypothetical protein